MISYADLINLNESFVPATGPADLSAAIVALRDDPISEDFVARFKVQDDPQVQRKWIQAALTVRPIGDLPVAVTEALDRLLQAELDQKSITDAKDLPHLRGRYTAANHVSIWNGDIASLKIGAVVNAANAQMLGCFQPFHACIDNVIQCAAGPQLREDCAKIVEHQGHLETTGTAKITRAYNLPSDFVIHTVGPIVLDHNPTPTQALELASCYTSCLSLAADAGIKSIALCGISTGVFGYPPEQAARVALQAVLDWVSANPDAIDHIVFNTYGAEAAEIYERITASWT
jgi:O-acetyl-ADP-ribose deacetylase (regulator of RNase III)